VTKRKRYNAFDQSSKRRGQPPTTDAPIERPNLATINLEAGAGKKGFDVGDTVRIMGSGLYSGETAKIERLTAGVIPSAVVRTDSGNTRTVRTIDLAPAKPAEN
jgi:hypothetical protein